MYPFPYFYEPFQQFLPAYNDQRTLQPRYNSQPIRTARPPLPSTQLVIQNCNKIKQKAKVISSIELSRALDELHRELKDVDNRQQYNANLKRIIVTLIVVDSSILATVTRHNFFDLLRAPLIQLLRQWHRASYLNESDVFLFRSIIKLTRKLLKNISEINLYPSWLFDSSLLDMVAACLTIIAESGKYLHDKNKRESKSFIRLFSLYIDYQIDLNEDKSSNQDILTKLLDPTVLCLTSNHYIDVFSKIQTANKSRKTHEKLFLHKCPSFLVSYHGSRLEQIMKSLLSAMLPKYLTLFSELMPSVGQWKQSTMRAVNQLIKIINHGPTSGKILATHLPIIDHILTLVDTSAFYSKLTETISNPATHLISTAIHCLAKMIGEPAILAHIKQKKMTTTFLRFTTAQYEAIVYDTYTILAHITTEKDINEMPNPGALLSTVTKSLKDVVIHETPDNQQQVGQLMEILKGLTQHDQMKEEVLKQDTFLFLLDCTKKFTGDILTLLLETLWSLSFSQQGALQLRAHPEFLEKVETISKSTTDEGMKKASDGLVWKLVQEPAFLEKVAKNQSEEKNQMDETLEDITEVVIGPDGKEQIITKTRRRSILPPEQIFQYDIMISYCHADKDLIIKIHQFLLDNGFKVWIDLNNMFGPAMSAMAEAVENSEFVIMCMSDSYKQSTYCQAEAEYAFGCKKRLLPLIVRQGYRPDGWLGFMIGSRIYIDYGRFDFDTACEKLINEIALQRKRPLPSKVTTVSQHEKPDMKPPPVKVDAEKPSSPRTLPDTYMKRKATFNYNKKSIYRWVESDVLDFLYNNQLHEFMALCEKMDGRALIQLYKMCTAHTHGTYTLLNDELNSTYKMKLPIGIYTRFLSVMERVGIANSQLMNLQYKAPPPRITITSPQETSLPPPIPPRRVQYQPQPYLQQTDLPYDIVVTSNASASEMLKMASRLVPHVQSMDPERRRRPLRL